MGCTASTEQHTIGTNPVLDKSAIGSSGTISRSIQNQKAESHYLAETKMNTSSTKQSATIQKNSNNITQKSSAIEKESRPSTPQQQQLTSQVKKKTPYVPPAPINTTSAPAQPVGSPVLAKKHPLPRPYNPLEAQPQAPPKNVVVSSSDQSEFGDTDHAIRGSKYYSMADDDTMNDLSYCDTTTMGGLESLYYDDNTSFATNEYGVTTHTVTSEASSNIQDIIGSLPDENNESSSFGSPTAKKSTTSNKNSKDKNNKNPIPSNTNEDDDEDDPTDYDFNGLLNFHQSGFDQTAISAITNLSAASNYQNEKPPTLANDSISVSSKEANPTISGTVTSQFEYPKEAPQPSSSSGMRFDELYRLKGVLGTGAFSTVREGYHKSSNQVSFAVKCINRKKLSEEDEAALLDEVSILKEMNHPHIIRLFDFFVEPSTYYIVMERMRGGELFDRIVTKAYYNEKEARDTCKIVLEAVSYCHENHVAHRDLKPENLLLLSDVDDSAVKIADFGFAKKVYEPNSLTTQCGTPGYVAPEILEGTAYDERADMWSVGVILYILLGGYPPFIESTQRDLFRKIRKGDYEFHEEYWGTVSTEAKELISSLLTVDRTVRLTADEALENAWILGDDAKLAQRDLGENLNKLRNFNGKRKFRAAVSTVMAVNKLNLVGKEFFSHYAKDINGNSSDDASSDLHLI